MASVKALAKKPKKKVVRGAPRIKRGSKLNEPNWEGSLDWAGEKFHKFKRDSGAWYYEHFKPADLYPAVFEWMKENGYSKEDVDSAKAAPASALSVTAGIQAKMLMNGMPDTNPKHDTHWASLPGTMGDKVHPSSEFLISRIKIAVELGSKVVEVKKKEAKATENVYTPSIQERIRDQAQDQAQKIEEWLEGFVIDKKTFDPKGFDFKKHFGQTGVTQAHARKLKNFYINELDDFKDLQRFPTSGQLKKMSEHEQDMWEQLKEGYAHIKKADIKNYTIAIEELMTALDFVIESAKATRAPRKNKPKSDTKLVEKLKFLKTDDKFKVASVTPEMVIGASELWVFNVKTRKLGRYIASKIDTTGMQREGSGLSVKGTTIIGFDEKLSIQKTMRKPSEQLKEFKSSGKVKLRSFLDDIKTTDTMLNGRCNPDTILLKVS
tara:strand:- start:2901 stop:4208 length:1308 start_codon:yes stop_codon:yes gene_type:complete